MKIRLKCILFLVSISTLLMAENDSYLISQRRFLKIMPAYQSWDIENIYQVSQVSSPIFLYVPVNRQISFSMRGNGGNISGDLPELSGLTDTQLMLNYHWESRNLVFNLGINIPNGKSELTPQEYLTSSTLSAQYLNFRIPNFGQGFNVSPGFTWARMINDQIAVGLGASYQYRGEFKPLEFMLDDYDPGDEFLFSGGVDIRINELATFTGDIVFTTYTTDKSGNNKVFDSGNTLLLNFQYKQYFQYNELLLRARYRSKSKNSYVIGGVFQQEQFNTNPEQVEAFGHYRIRLNPRVNVGILGEVHSYLSNSVFSGLDIVGIGLLSDFSVQKSISIPMRIKYLFGDFRSGKSIAGWEIGLGAVIGF